MHAEMQLFDAIDGDSSVRAIVEKALPSSAEASRVDMVRNFFERLWWHDQVVFHIPQIQKSIVK